METEYLMPHWHEGMLLKTQHLQALARVIERQSYQALRFVTPYYFGIERLEISRDEVSSGSISIRSGRLYLKDGVRIRIPEETEPPARDFLEALDACGGDLLVHLGIPKRRGYALSADSVAGARYLTQFLDCEDENQPACTEPIAFRRFNARIFFGTEDLAGYEAIPTARIRRSSGRDGAPELDPFFCPPCVDLKAIPMLKNLAHDALHFLDGKARGLAEQLRGSHISYSTEVKDPEGLLKLSKANEHLLELKQLLGLPALHPLAYFMAMVRLIGGLSLFTPSRTVAHFDPYEHMNPGKSFQNLLDQLKELWKGEDRRYYDYSDFNSADGTLVASLPEDWLDRGLDLYIGVDSAASPEEVCLVFSKNVRLGAPQDMETLERFNVRGLNTVFTKKTPPTLPDHDGMHYFRIDRNGSYWKGVKREKKLVLGYMTKTEEWVQAKLHVGGRAEGIFRLYAILQNDRKGRSK